MFSVRKTTEQFIVDAKNVHGDKYDYSLVDYKGKKVKVDIVCKTHGVFKQRPNEHLTGNDCRKCSYEQKHTGKRKNLEDFISEAVSVHGDLYDYSKVVYRNNKAKIEVICKTHGSFFPTPKNHINGSTCPSCSLEFKGWNKSRFCNAAEKHGGAIIYLIRCYNRFESFYKIGITVNSVKVRFSGCMPYKYKTISTVSGNGEEIWQKERELLRLVNKVKFIPNIDFAGSTECFSELTQEVKDFFGVQI